ncbi:MAG: glycosyl hydrolase family 65 protein [Anaerolineaceae bacterium]|nr:glycosyl hydrolase family 65 protein [Anaerolineaceae bacterium]
MSKYVYQVNEAVPENGQLLLHETLFHNANGYLGVRASLEEGRLADIPSVRGMYINGFYDFVEMKQAEKLYGLVEEKQTMLNVADTQGIKLFIDGEEFSLFTGKVLQNIRTLDMKAGVTSRDIVWQSPAGKTVKIFIRRMASFTHLPLFLIDYQVMLQNCSARLTFRSDHIGEVSNYFNPDDPRVASESVKLLEVKQVIQDLGASFIEAKTSRSELLVCSGVTNLLNGQPADSSTCFQNEARAEFSIQADDGQLVQLLKYTVLTDSIRSADPLQECKKVMAEIIAIPVDTLYSEQQAYLSEAWQKCALDIEADFELDEALHYNTYQLIQSVSKDEFGNIAAKGLSGEGYEGHYFWDTEMFIEPFFVLTMPELSRNLIGMRYKTLDAARENARIMGYSRGALFPWRTIMGKECSGHYPSGTAQVHINGDIAYSVIAYYLATNDWEFMCSMGAELIFEICRHWLESGNFYQAKFNLNGVTGPDEYTCLVNNNYYTNALAKYNLEWAVKVYDLLKSKKQLRLLEEKIDIRAEEVAEFKRASEQMVLLYDEALKINPQDDSFLQKKPWDFAGTPKENFPLLMHYHPLHLYRYQVCKQADTVMAYFILEDYQSKETMRNSFEYYQKITTHDSSLSTCIFSIVAARLGYPEQAKLYFNDSAKLDLFDTHHNTKDGIHTANMGGNYMAIVYGFAGLRLKEDGLHFTPILPQGWKGYSFTVQYQGSRIRVSITADQAKFELISGNPQYVWVDGEAYGLRGTIMTAIK